MSQLAIPIEISLSEVERKPSLGKAIELCYEAAGFEPKQLIDKINRTNPEIKFDKGQISRRESGGEGIVWPKFTALMDCCGNDAPLLWMNFSRGWDLHAMRRRESELERENRLLREERDALKRVLMGRADHRPRHIPYRSGTHSRPQPAPRRFSRLRGTAADAGCQLPARILQRTRERVAPVALR